MYKRWVLRGNAVITNYYILGICSIVIYDTILKYNKTLTDRISLTIFDQVKFKILLKYFRALGDVE